MRIKCLFAILIAILLSQQICYAQIFSNAKPKANSKKKQESNLHISVWPIFFVCGTFFFTVLGSDEYWPGYSVSGGLTFHVGEGEIAFFSDLLYSFRAFDGYPQSVHYRIEEITADISAAVALGTLYVGGYVKFPMNTVIRVNEWTMEDFSGVTSLPSFSLMGGMRIKGKHLGADARLLLGQGPGQYISGGSLGDHWLGQISLGFMFGF
jgi:hypothetical protein